MSGRLSLTEQLARLAQPIPVDFDPENLTPPEEGSDNEAQVAPSAAREHYFEVGPSSLRKLNDSLADPKYAGVKTNRKNILDVQEPEEDWQNSDDEEEEDADEEDDDKVSGEDGVGPNVAPSDSEEDEEDYEDAGQTVPESKRPVVSQNTRPQVGIEPQKEDDLMNTLQTTREADLRKGKAVMRQMTLWDALLDARIRLQKSSTTVNKILSSSSKNFLESPELQDDLHKYLEESILLAEDLFELQETLLIMNELTKPPPRKKRRIQEDDNLESYTAYFTEATTSSVNLEQNIHPWLVQTLSKWSAKIQAVAPSVLLPSNRNAFSKKSQNIKHAVQMVEEALLDHPRLLTKTRIPRGKTKSDVDSKEEDFEIFDDTDFYQQLLRDVIESRGEGASADDDWMAMQRERKSKKKVDTKASKGRKLRYGVHEKLQNFMAPAPVVGAWHEERIDELFGSLLGKGFETVTEDGVTAPGEVEGTISGGFRVFG